MSKVILLAALEEACPALQLPDGREVAIRQIDGIGMQLLQAAQEGDVALFWEAAARCLPDMAHDDVMKFTITQAVRVVEVASGQAERVLAAVERPAAPVETGPPAQPSPIPSGT